MNDQELADAIVAAGIGSKGIIDSNMTCYTAPNDHKPLKAHQFVRDPRVAMAMLEGLADGELTIWPQRYDDGGPNIWIVETHLQNADGRDESLPRAISMACAEALSNE